MPFEHTVYNCEQGKELSKFWNLHLITTITVQVIALYLERRGGAEGDACTGSEDVTEMAETDR